MQPNRIAASARLLIVLAAGVFLSACAEPPAEATRAKNVILFIGDGMGVSTVTAARIFDGQSQGMTGEEHWLAFERFQNVALVKTYNSNQQVPDSAGTATAMLTGQKTRAGVINVAPEAQRSACEQAMTAPLTSLAEIASERGLATGVVTTARITHATPATMYAHSPERNWEHDGEMLIEALAAGCRDIASQLVESSAAGGLDVAMGGGRRAFYGSNGNGRRASPDDDLPAAWESASDNHRLVTTRDDMLRLAPGDRALGLFSRSHMTYLAERPEGSDEPLLSEMALKALELLEGDEDGYFLMVEGGRIDHGHHDGKPGYALLQAQEFNRAVEAVLVRIDLDETLVLVTADHSHVFTMGGYATRGNPILGLVHGNDSSGEPTGEPMLAADGQPYTTLGYYNGPGAVTEMPRPWPETGLMARAQSLVPMVSVNADGSIDTDETHGGEDVALYATGAGAEMARGVIEQNRIYDIMREAWGW